MKKHGVKLKILTLFQTGKCRGGSSLRGLTSTRAFYESYISKSRFSEHPPHKPFGFILSNTIVQQAEACVPVKTRWEPTFDVISDLIVILDKEHRIVQVNKAMAKRLGVTPEKCIGQYCYACIHDAAEPPAFCPHTQLIHDGQKHTAEVYEPHLGGHFLVTVSPLFNDQRELIGSIHIAQDIMEHKRTEEALKTVNDELKQKIHVGTAELIRVNMQLAEKIGVLTLTEKTLREKESIGEALQDSEKRYRRLFESAKDGILILDADTGKVVDVNPFLLQLLGYSHDAICGQYIWELGVFKDIAASKDAFKALQDK